MTDHTPRGLAALCLTVTHQVKWKGRILTHTESKPGLEPIAKNLVRFLLDPRDNPIMPNLVTIHSWGLLGKCVKYNVL